jgi:hypothetical protein
MQGLGFCNNPVDVLVRGDNPAALKTRNTPVHDYTFRFVDRSLTSLDR